jgi:hypothetical protein
MARKPRASAYLTDLKVAIDQLLGSGWKSPPRHGNSRWEPLQLLTACILMSWHEAQTLTARFEHVRELLSVLFPHWRVPRSYTGYAAALAREINCLVDGVRSQLQKSIQQCAGRSWKIAGWIVFAADGSRFESPRTWANEKGLGCAGKTRTAPQVFHTSLLHLGTQTLWDFRCGRGTDSERRHLEDMAQHLPAHSLVTADAGFVGYELCQRLNAQGVSFLLRVGGNITLLKQRFKVPVTCEGDQVWLWPPRFRSDPPCVLRLLRIPDGQREMFLVTNILQPEDLSLPQASGIYRRRWGIEVTYRSVKQTFNRARWLSRSPSSVLAEHQSTILGYWILQVLSLRELSQRRQDLCRWSPAQARNTMRRVIRSGLNAGCSGFPHWRAELGNALQDSYLRRHPKRARSWPHKKHDPPIQPPRIRALTPKLRQKGLDIIKTTG